MEGAHNDKKSKITTITAKVYITSLNAHYLLRELSTEFGSWVSMSEVWSM